MMVELNYTDATLSLTASSINTLNILSNVAEMTAAASSSSSSSASSPSSLSSQENPMDYLRETVTKVNASVNRTVPLDVLLERFTRNRSIDEPWYHILIAMYSALILFGALGNVLVVIAVLRKPVMRTARNLFILNLAISDLLLCLVTMPLTLMELLSKYWPFGTCAILCKMIAMLQALSIFVSTISITAIAFDRYQVIVYPTRDSLQVFGAVAILMGIWLLALTMASPMFIFKRLVHADIPPLLQEVGVNGVSFCIEDWPVANGRFIYSIFSLAMQYVLPILMVSVAYFGIYNKLRSRITVVTVHTTQRKIERGRRMKRTNCLLISIAVIFGVSWLPLNFFNLYADMKRSAVTQSMLVTYAICHMIGMSSACSNPLLYGWLNDNFRKEFQELLCRTKHSTNNDNNSNGHTTGGGRRQTRRRRKHADIAKGDLNLLGDGTTGSCCGVGGGGGGGGGGGDGGEGGGGGGGGGSGNRHDKRDNGYSGGLRSAVTESVALTENPMSTEVTTLMPR